MFIIHTLDNLYYPKYDKNHLTTGEKAVKAANRIAQPRTYLARQ
jgi:hypothetical protein